ncbi:MAG: hypothetical protein ABL952_03180 [Pyrinomonadaceae bacterium]
MQRLFLFLLLVVFATGAFGQAPASGFDLTNYGVKIEPDKRLIVVLASLEMAQATNADGTVTKLINTPLSADGAKFRDQLILDNASMPADLRTRISTFVAQHKKRNPKATDAEIVAPFISMAYSLSPVPELGDPVVTSDLPGKLLDVLDYSPLVREFYKRSLISSKLDSYFKTYREQADGRLRTSTRDMVSELLEYLHTRPQLIFSEKVKIETKRPNSKEVLVKTEIREHARRFIVVPENLSAKGDINFLNIRDDYYLIVPPDTDVSITEGRRAFLRFVIDPLILANSKEMTTIRDWAKPVLEELRKTDSSISPDVFLAMSRSLVAGVDIRQAEFTKNRIATDLTRQKLPTLKTDAEKIALTTDLAKQTAAFADEAAQQLFEEYQKGAVLSFYFAEQLKGIEDSGFDIASSLREMIAAFEPAKEINRLSDTAEARKRALAVRQDRKSHPDAVAIVESPLTAKLIAIQKVIDGRDLTKANANLKQLLKEYPSEPRIYYNIGRVAGLSAVGVQDPEVVAQRLLESKVAFTNVLNTATSNTDKSLLSLTYVALARIYEFDNNSAYAIKLYDEAIKLDDISGGAFREAIAGKQRLLKPQ